MTDEHIINILKRSKGEAETDEVRAFLDDVIECINRQAAEIESLKQIIDEKDKEILGLQKRIIFWREDLNYQPEKIKSEAIKEFAERAETLVLPLLLAATLEERDMVYRCLNIIANLVKEMTEENE